MATKEIALERNSPKEVALDRTDRTIPLSKVVPLYIELREVICADIYLEENKRTIKGIFDSGGKIESMRCRLHHPGLPSSAWITNPLTRSTSPHVGTNMFPLRTYSDSPSNQGWWGGNHFTFNLNGNIRFNAAFDKYDVFWGGSDGAMVDEETGNTTFPSMLYDSATHDPPYIPIETFFGYYSNYSGSFPMGWNDIKRTDWVTLTIDEENKTFQGEIELLKYGEAGTYNWRGIHGGYGSLHRTDSRFQFLEIEIRGAERPPTDEEVEEGEESPVTFGRRAYMIWGLPLYSPRSGFQQTEHVGGLLPGVSKGCYIGPYIGGCCYTTAMSSDGSGRSVVNTTGLNKKFWTLRWKRKKYYPVILTTYDHDFKDGDNVLALPFKFEQSDLSRIKKILATSVNYDTWDIGVGLDYNYFTGELPPENLWDSLEIDISSASISEDGYYLVFPTPFYTDPLASDWYLYMIFDWDDKPYYGTVKPPETGDPVAQVNWTLQTGGQKTGLFGGASDMCPLCAEVCVINLTNYNYAPADIHPNILTLTFPSDPTDGRWHLRQTADSPYYGCTNYGIGNDGVSDFNIIIDDHGASQALELGTDREWYQSPVCPTGNPANSSSGGFNGYETARSCQITKLFSTGPGKVPYRSSGNLIVVLVAPEENSLLPGNGSGIGYTAGDLIFENWSTDPQSLIPTGYYNVTPLGSVSEIFLTFGGRKVSSFTTVRPQPGGNYADLRCQFGTYTEFLKGFGIKIFRVERVEL